MLVGSYNLLLVFLSLLVATLASYTALNMAERMYATQSEHTKLWHIGGSIAMGVGIWSMHFIGMLAFRLPIAVGYDLILTFLSLFIAIAVSYFALWQVSVSTLTKRRILMSAVLMGLGIAAMHYTGMEAMQMFPAIHYQKPLLVLSVAIAMLASYAALHIILRVRSSSQTFHLNRLFAALVMGLAIVGMHYTGMMAAQFPSDSICRAADMGIQPQMLAIFVGLASFVLLGGSNFASYFDARTRFFVNSLATANQALKTQALYDPLTHLPNRVLLEERVKAALHQASHHQHDLAYLAINLDGFSAINDSMGHAVGDKLLFEVASRLRILIEPQFAVARITSDEFVVLLEQITPADAAVTAESILAAIKKPILIEGKEYVTSASVGIAVFPSSGKKYQELAFHANAALKHLKKSGKNGYQFYEDKMDSTVAYNLALIADLRYAIELNQLSLHYQPKFDVETNCVFSAEALLRWEHPQHGWVSPEKFIPLAEESGLIESVGDWVLHQACAQIKSWRKSGYKAFNIAINLSLVQLTDKNIYQKIVDALNQWDLPANSLTIEVTESTAMQDVEHSLAILQKIADLGVKVSIDDFGTGYSSLLYLKRLPATELKIDRGFIKSVCTSSEDGLLVSGMITLGHEFGLNVVAEGVETKEQKDFLSSLGCNTLQGYFMGKPKTPRAFILANKKYMKKAEKNNSQEKPTAAKFSYKS